MSRPQRWTFLLAAALVATAVATATAGPAAASVPGRETRTASSIQDQSEDWKVADVACTGNRWLLSSGVSVEGPGARFVVVDELVPELDRVTAYAHESNVGTTQDWSLRVWAICADRAGSHRTSYATSPQDSDNKGVTVSCPDEPANLVVTGVGWEIEGGPGEVVIETITPTADSVRVDAYEIDDDGLVQMGATWFVRAYATCVTRPPGYEIVDDTSTSNSSAKPGAADCSSENVLLGGAIDLIGFRGRINAGALVPAYDSALTYADEVVSTTNNWSIKTYAICADR